MNATPDSPEVPNTPGSDLAASDSAGISFGDIFGALLKHKWLILACALICLAIGACYAFLKTPVYEASGTLRIDPSRAGSLGLGDSLGLSPNADVLQTEMAILQTDQVAITALNSLSPADFRKYSGLNEDKIAPDPKTGKLSRADAELIDGFKGALTVKQVEGTQLIGITYRGSDPEMAATLVNKAVDAYMRVNFDSRYNSVSQVQTWLQAQMDDLRQRAAAAQRKLADFQEHNNLIGTDATNNTTMDSLRMLNQRVAAAEGDRIVKEAQLRAAEAGDPAVLATLLSDAHLQALQSDEARLYAQYSQLSSKFGPAYPPLIDVKQQLASVRAQISKDIGTISGRLREDYQAAHQTEDMLRKEYQGETEKAYALNRTQADYNVLVAEGTSSRELYDTLQFKLQQASVNAGLNAINTMVIDRARVPIYPVEPKKTLIMAFGLLLGLAAGIGASLLRESLNDEILNAAQVESQAGLMTLGTIPSVSKPLSTLHAPRSRGADAYRKLRNALLLGYGSRPPKSILVTSSLPGEGKTTAALNFAIVLAQRASKVLLVDADLRQPSLHTQLSVANTKGVSAILLGESALEVLHPLPELPTLSFLPAGEGIDFPSEALGSVEFRNKLKSFEREYDFVVLDSAPILTVSDSLPLATWVDAIVLVARARMTPLKALQKTKATLLRAHARLAGVLLTDVAQSGGDSEFVGKDGHGYYR